MKTAFTKNQSVIFSPTQIAKYSKIASGLIALILLLVPIFLAHDLEGFKNLGYAGFFLANYFGVGVVVLPFLILTLNPFLLVLVGSVGVTIDEFFPWYAGSISEELNRKSNFDAKVSAFVKKRGALAIFTLGLIPLPDGFIYALSGFAAGFYGMSFKKFFLANFLGKLIRTTIMVAGFYYAMVK